MEDCFIFNTGMEKVEELRHELVEAHSAFQMAQKRKWHFLKEYHQTIMNILVVHLENLRTSMQEYFELRNEGLHNTLKDIDDNLNQASDVHTALTSYRSKLLDACNNHLQPQATVTDASLLINGQGIDDLHAVSSQTESCVLLVNNLQDKYCALMSDIEEKIPEKISAILSETECQIKVVDEARYKEAMGLLERSKEELDKAIQILEGMEKMKQQMECLFEILRKPATST